MTACAAAVGSLAVEHEVRLHRDGEREAAVAVRCACSGVTAKAALRQYSSTRSTPVDRFTEPLYAPRNLPMVSATGSCTLPGQDKSSETTNGKVPSYGVQSGLRLVAAFVGEEEVCLAVGVVHGVLQHGAAQLLLLLLLSHV